ncbi:hypothetical protein ABZT03_40995 [Streptomyces sp. NPDC005574]|uniref:hypothetical protein n=1 Tax=Streptomyces sp. NPDC005574 TaxID=3156891 RepID=UPI0033B385B6
MSLLSWSAVLVVGDEQAPVEAELGELTPAGGWEWGGLLRGVPARFSAAMRQGEGARLRLPDGQERRLHPAEMPKMDSQGLLVVPFVGEGTTPAG